MRSTNALYNTKEIITYQVGVVISGGYFRAFTVAVLSSRMIYMSNWPQSVDDGLCAWATTYQVGALVTSRDYSVIGDKGASRCTGADLSLSVRHGYGGAWVII